LRRRAAGHYDPMTIGASIFLIAVGAILKYAVTATVAGIEIQTVGLILMIAGIVGLVIGLFLLTQTERRRTVVYDDPPRDPVAR
jgi:membrane-bound ClpP family serine protease